MNFFRYMMFIAVLSSSSLYSMEKQVSSRVRAITQIPQYLYENCNHMVRHRWSIEKFHDLKKRAETITVDEVRAECNDEDSFIKACELYDWIHCLNYIERELLPAARLEVGDIVKINSCLTRLVGGNGGSFRSQGELWPKYTIDEDTERWLDGIFNLFAGAIKSGSWPLKMEEGCFKTAELVVFLRLASILMYLDPSPHLIDEPSLSLNLADFPRLEGIARDLIRSKKSLFIEPWWQIAIKPDRTGWKIDTDIAYAWEKEQEGMKGYKEGFINYEAYYLKRYHLFPDPTLIPRFMRSLEGRINDATEDEAIIAAYAWFFIVEIHAFAQANKRTGKAVSLIPLLKKGGYPPLIEGESGKELVKLFQEAFNDSESDVNYVQFVSFFTQRMSQTNMHMSDLREQSKQSCSVCQSPENLKACSRCKQAFYCSVEHQKQDWPTHKLRCAKQ